MKGFFSAAAAAFISGILLLVAAPFVQTRTSAPTEKARIALSKSDDYIQIDKNAAQAMDRFFSDGDSITQSSRADQTISINTASVENTGNADAQNFDVTIRSLVEPEVSDILAFGRIGTRDDDVGRQVQSSSDGETVRLRFPLLRAGERYSLWYAFSPFNITEISSRIPNVEVVGPALTAADFPTTSDSNDEFPWSIVLGLLFGAAAFFLGIGLCAYFYEEMLRKVGLDPKEVMELYRKAQEDAANG